MSNPNNSLALSVKDACELAGIGPNKFYDAIRDGHLKARKIGRKTVVLRADLEKYLDALPALDLSKNPYTPKARNMNPVGKRKNAVEGVAA
jgi:excisionase family DNA binding protein